MADELEQHLSAVTLVDHHVHGSFSADGGEDRFQNSLNESNTASLSNPAAAYDSQLGFAIRRWCAPLLDLPEHVPAADYWRRRTELGERAVARRMFAGAGVGDWLVDSGFAGEELLDPITMSDLAPGRVHEIVRLESVAEEVISTVSRPADYPDAFRAAVVSGKAVAMKSIVAYRAGFDIDFSRPSNGDVAAAAARWADQLPVGRSPRLVDPVLLRFGLHAGLETGLPLQLHVGLGDRDLDLRRVNPLHLLDFLRAHERSGVPVVLLHCYPYEREAGYLAQAFETVYFDVGLAVNFVGARSPALIARSLELAPFHKILYSSDACGPAELHYLGAKLWRVGTARVLQEWVANGDWSAADARRVAEMIAAGNARRVYGLT